MVDTHMHDASHAVVFTCTRRKKHTATHTNTDQGGHRTLTSLCVRLCALPHPKHNLLFSAFTPDTYSCSFGLKSTQTSLSSACISALNQTKTKQRELQAQRNHSHETPSTRYKTFFCRYQCTYIHLCFLAQQENKND